MDVLLQKTRDMIILQAKNKPKIKQGEIIHVS